MAATTTLPDVIDGMVSTVIGLAGMVFGDHRFKVVPPDHDLRTWVASGATEAHLRRFEVVPIGTREDPLVEDPDTNHYGQDVEILVAYPAKLLRLYGDLGLRGLERAVALDASLIRDAMYDSANMPDGATFIPRVGDVDRDGEDAWFAPVLVRVQWFELKNL